MVAGPTHGSSSWNVSVAWCSVVVLGCACAQAVPPVIPSAATTNAAAAIPSLTARAHQPRPEAAGGTIPQPGYAVGVRRCDYQDRKASYWQASQPTDMRQTWLAGVGPGR